MTASFQRVAERHSQFELMTTHPHERIRGSPQIQRVRHRHGANIGDGKRSFA
jgi:hypothetical protein